MATRILHISDTHFTRGLRERDKSLYQKLVLRGGLRSHDFQVLSALSAKLHRIMFQFGKFDLVVVTGDVSTDGDSQSLQTAHTFFSQGEIRSGDPGHFIVNGFDRITNATLVLPGNHDRYVTKALIPVPLQLDFGNFESVFGEPSYPFELGISRGDRQKASDDADLIVFAFDSTAVNQPPFGHSPHELIARGFIDDQACSWLELKAEEIASNGIVSDMTGRKIEVNYDECVKLAVLHHHPVELGGPVTDNLVRTKQSRFDPGGAQSRWTTLENRERFLKACFSANIDLILFGHQHHYLHRELDENMREIQQEAREARGIHFLCCPTTTQLGQSEKGFYIYSVQPGHFDVEFYTWDEEDFDFKLDRQRSNRFTFHRGRIGFSKSASPSA